MWQASDSKIGKGATTAAKALLPNGYFKPYIHYKLGSLNKLLNMWLCWVLHPMSEWRVI